MADNNIKVNWIVNTADVERAKQILQQADQVGNKFQQTAQQGFKAASAEASKLVAEEKRLETAIKNTQRSSFTSYQAYTKQLQGLSRQYADVKTKIDLATKAIHDQSKAQKELNTTTKSLATSFGGLYNTIRSVIAAGLAREAVNMTLEMAKLAGNVEGVSRAFNRAFPAGQLILSELRQATRGTVSDFELMQRTLQATNLGVSVEHLGVLFEFAATRAQQTGESVDYLVDSIVRGIGRKSLLILDNLGLSAVRLKEEFNGASLASQSVARVTEGVANIARVELEKMGGFAETTATKVDQLSVSWTRLREEFAKSITGEGGAVDALNSALEGLRAFMMGEKAFKLEFLSGQAIADIQLFTNGIKNLDEDQKLEEVQQKLNSIVQIVGKYNDEIKRVQAQVRQGEGFGFPGFSEENQAGAKRYNELVQQYGNKAKQVFDQEIKDARLRLLALNDNKKVLELTIPLLQKYMQSLMAPDAVVTQLGLIAEKEEEIKSVAEAIEAAKSVDEIAKLNNSLSKLNGELADLKAFGTTKQFIEVNGQVKLVPIEDYKIKSYKLQTTNAIGELEIKTKLVLGTSQDPNAGIKQTQDEIQAMIDQMRFTIPSPAPASGGVTPMSEWERIGQEFADNWQNILTQGIGDTANILDAAVQKEADSYDAKINQARAYYDNLSILAGDNEKEKDRLRIREAREIARLRREAFEADKRAKRSQAVINGAAGVVNAFATLPYPAALVASVLIAAQTAAQIAIINSEQPRFAKGVIDLKGPGSKTSDSINAKLSKGESVMTADETDSSMGILKDIRAGKLNDRLLARKLDSAMLKDLKLSGNGVTYAPPRDDGRIVKKIDQLIAAQPDYENINGELWKTRKKSENYKQWVRAKIM